MKTFFIILFALIIGAGIGFGVYKFVKKDESEVSKDKTVTLKNYKEPFLWGIHNNPSALRNYSSEMWKKQMKFVIELEVPWIRLPLDAQAPSHLEQYDEMIAIASQNNVQSYLLLSSTEPILSLKDPRDDGEKVGKAVAEHFKGKIKYYQLMSEQGSTAIKGGEYSGEKESDYDPEKYKIVREWMDGASKAIRKADPDAYIVINDQWTHYAYFDMLIRDKIDFDIIGWNWFGDMGMMGDRKLENGTMLVDKIKSFNKPVILTEVNDRPGKKGMDEAKQADFITKMANWANKNDDLIKGFIIHELFDLRPNGDKPGDFYGLIEYKKSGDGGYTIGDEKQAFEAYKKVIQKYQGN